MEHLGLHHGGKIDYLKDLKRTYRWKIKAIKNDDSLSGESKKKAIQQLKDEHQKLVDQANNNLF